MDTNYYTSYLRAYLTEVGDVRKDDDDFIESRADASSEEFEERRRDGMNVFDAQECAMNVLLEGVECV